MAVDRGDHRLTQIPDAHQGVEVELDVTIPVSLVLWRIGLQCLWVQVEAGRECLPARAGEQDHADVFIGVDAIQDIAQFGQESLRQGVVLLRPVEGDGGNSIALRGQQVFVGHWCSPYSRGDHSQGFASSGFSYTRTWMICRHTGQGTSLITGKEVKLLRMCL